MEYQWINGIYPLVNKQLDPENSQCLMETSLPTPFSARVYVNLPEGKLNIENRSINYVDDLSIENEGVFSCFLITVKPL